MQGFSPKLPLVRDRIDGSYSMNKTALESVKQNLKMLLLTNPGERMMLPDYGVGLRAMLFAQNSSELDGMIKNRIDSQVKQYMPFVSVKNIDIATMEQNENAIYIKVSFVVPSLRLTEEINFVLGAN